MIMAYAVYIEIGHSSVVGCIFYWDKSTLYWPHHWCNLSMRVSTQTLNPVLALTLVCAYMQTLHMTLRTTPHHASAP